MAYSAAAMYGGAALDELITGSIPGDPPLDVGAVSAAAVVVAALLTVGPRLPRWSLAALGPIGVALIAQALVGAPTAGDAAMLYLWPVLWTSFFFGRRGAIAIVACIGVAHGAVLLTLPAAASHPGRWMEVMIPVCTVAVIVLMLVDRNARLLGELADEARVDALTGLLNRRGFQERAAPELARARRERGWLAIATFDIDHFKRINDEWGHDVGDRVLVRMGALLAAESREVDVVARFGGEEFVVLLSGGDSSAARSLAERVRAALAADDGANLPTVRASAGVHAAVAPDTIQEVHGRADIALYHAKRGGRDRTEVFAPREEHGRESDLLGVLTSG